MAVLLIDADNFRELNDLHGHAVGDRALIAIAEAVREAVRASDLIARYGGDEFAIVAPETSGEELAQLVDRVLSTVRGTEVESENGDRLTLTVSLGSAIAEDPEGSEPRSLEDLFAAADRGLYAAKQEGRDRASVVVVLEPQH
jgi:diguanylate cyclase (GGDEF)-like protein